MIEAELRVEGLDKIFNAVGYLERDIEREMNRIWYQIGEMGVPVLKANTPRKTGNLAESTTYIVPGKGYNSRLEFHQPALSPHNRQAYGRYVREGTKPHTIYPKNAKALRFTAKGEVVFAKKVNHPGTKANLYHLEALRQMVARTRDILDQSVGRVISNVAAKGGKK